MSTEDSKFAAELEQHPAQHLLQNQKPTHRIEIQEEDWNFPIAAPIQLQHMIRRQQHYTGDA
jgi:hypothetical protein